MLGSQKRFAPPPNLTSWDVARLLVGLLLLVSASLKLHQLLTVSTVSADWLASPRVQWLAVGWESALAFWLFSNWRANVARWVAVATFGVFAAVSLHEAVAGKRTCCCFGMVQATPWVVFGLDIAIAARLYLVRGITVRYPLKVRYQRTMAITVTALSIICGVTAAAWHNGARPGLQIHNWP